LPRIFNKGVFFGSNSLFAKWLKFVLLGEPKILLWLRLRLSLRIVLFRLAAVVLVIRDNARLEFNPDLDKGRLIGNYYVEYWFLLFTLWDAVPGLLVIYYCSRIAVLVAIEPIG